MKGVLYPEKVAEMPMVAAWLRQGEAARQVVLSTPGLDEQARLDRLIEQNVVAQLHHLRTHPTVAVGLSRGTLEIHGWVLYHRERSDRRLQRGGGTLVEPRPDAIPSATPTSMAGRQHEREIALRRRCACIRGCFPRRAAALHGHCDRFRSCPPRLGLITGVIGGIVVGFLAGSPLQVSGPAAGLTVIVYELIQKHGIEMLGPAVALAGVLQLIAGSVESGGGSARFHRL